MTPDEREMTLDAEIEALSGVMSAVGEFAAVAGLSERRRQHLDLAVEEAFVNVCRYAYDGRPGPVEIRMTQVPGEVRVAFVDRGGEFDPLATEAPDPNVTLNDRRAGGMGIFLMRQITDELHYRRESDRNVFEIVIRERAEPSS